MAKEYSSSSSSSSEVQSKAKSPKRALVYEGKQRANFSPKKPKLMEKQKPTPTPTPPPKKKNPIPNPIPPPEESTKKKKDNEKKEIPPPVDDDEDSDDEDSDDEKDEDSQQQQQQQQQVDEAEELKVEVKRSGSHLFQKVWTDDDEILLMKTLVEKGSRNFLPAPFQKKYSRRQLTDKIRRLQKRYNTNLHNRKTMSRHETELFNLSKMFWGVDDETSPQPQPQSQSRGKTKTIDLNGLDSASSGRGLSSLSKAIVRMGFDANVASSGLDGMNEDGTHLEDEWKKLCLLECKLFSKKLKLALKKVKSIRDSIQLTKEDN